MHIPIPTKSDEFGVALTEIIQWRRLLAITIFSATSTIRGLLQLLPIVWHFFCRIANLIVSILLFWQWRLLRWLINERPRQRLGSQLRNTVSYAEWLAIGAQLDRLRGVDIWRATPRSNRYDYRLIMTCYEQILQDEEEGDFAKLRFHVQSGLIRNFGNINDINMYNKSYCGTKILVENYIAQICKSFTDIQKKCKAPVKERQFFLHCRKSYGSTVLVLQGSQFYELTHLGVIYMLSSSQLLPRIILGVGPASSIAALVCMLTDEELGRFFYEIYESRPESAAIKYAVKNDVLGKVIIKSLLSSDCASKKLLSYAADSLMQDNNETIPESESMHSFDHIKSLHEFKQFCRDRTENLTFEQAFQRTKRVLNVVIPNIHGGDCPSLLNHLTAPNVLIWSAIDASISHFFKEKPRTIMCIDSNGRIIAWKPNSSSKTSSRKWSNIDTESAILRLSELFNVNHAIISYGWPNALPGFASDLHRQSSKGKAAKLVRIFSMELQHRLRELHSLGVIPDIMNNLLVHFDTSGSQIVLGPYLRKSDFIYLANVPFHYQLSYWILRGQQVVWPALELIRSRCLIEYALDDIVMKRQSKNKMKHKNSLSLRLTNPR